MTKRQIKFISIIVLSLATLIYGTIGSFFSEDRQAADNSIIIKKVHDGDTISAVVNNKYEKIRLIGIDTPEMGQRPWGSKAGKYLENLIDASSGRVLIEYDVEKRDKYGRILAYIWTKDGRMVNEEMLRNGFALLFTFPPNVKYVNKLMSAQKDARDKKIGIWGKNGIKQRPYDYRREHPRHNQR
ncbi:MAG: thermonuclease family protein [Nitrospirota bacterium]